MVTYLVETNKKRNQEKETVRKNATKHSLFIFILVHSTAVCKRVIMKKGQLVTTLSTLLTKR